MSEMMKPNVGADLLRIHRLITRGIEVALDRSEAFAMNGYPDAATREGFICYTRALVGVLHGHHLTEDEIAFPYFRKLLPDAPFDALSEDHRHMEIIIDNIKDLVDTMEAAPSPAADPLAELNRALMALQDLWLPHIATEQIHLSVEAADRLLSDEEQIRLGQQFGQHSAQHSQPDYLVVPFMLYNLEPEDRAVMSALLPPIITQQLIPGPWKDQWAPMRPFLLD